VKSQQRQQNHRGFTLIEVLVALMIVAMALMTGLKVSGALVNNAQRQTDALLAQLCADNALLQIRLSQQLPGVGNSRVSCPLTVRGTPNPSFRRVDAQVFDAQTPILRISTVVGRY
jgi:general secretion pathway protein I